MIPVQLTLEGFRQACSAVTLNFENASVWWLQCPGDWADDILGALAFALAETPDDEALASALVMHPDADFLRVEFDFKAGGHIYRVRRTLDREGKSSVRVFHLIRSAALDQDVNFTEAVPGIENVQDLRGWIAKTVGPGEGAFSPLARLTPSVSAALLAPGAEANSAFLRSLVDPSLCERLQARARQHQQRLEAQAKRWRDQIQEPDSPGGLGERAEGRATDGRSMSGERARLEELKRVLPALREIVALQSRLASSRDTSEKLRVRADAWSQQLQSARQEIGLLDWQLQSARESVQRYEVIRDISTQSLIVLGSQMHDINEWERLGDELKLLDAQLETYPANLDELIALATAEVESGRELEAVQPLLTRLFDTRGAWQVKRAHLEALHSEWTAGEAKLQALRSEAARHEMQLEAANGAADVARRAMLQSETSLEIAREALDAADAREVGDELLCHHCGQPRPQTSREGEARLEHAYNTAQEALEAARHLNSQAEAASRDALRVCDEWQHAVGARVAMQAATREKIRAAQRESELLAQVARETFALLPEAFADLVYAAVTGRELAPGEAEGGLELASTYPNAATLREIEACLRLQPQNYGRLTRWREQFWQREVIYARRQPAALRWGQLTARYNATAETIRAEYQRTHAALRAATQALTDLTLQIRFAQQGWEKAQRVWADARAAVDSSQILLAVEIRTQRELIESLERGRAALPTAWSARSRTLGTFLLRDLEAEKTRLQSACESEGVRAPEKTPAPHEGTLKENPLGGNPLDEKSLPYESPVGESPVETLELPRHELESQLVAAERNARLHAILVEALGSEALQNALWQDAQSHVLDRVNEVLNDISFSSLHLEPPRAPKAISEDGWPLDFESVASPQDGPSRRLDRNSLSSVQRFRIALSLVLGLGQGDSPNPWRPNAIILDARFAGLDALSADQIADELRGLARRFPRVILVSPRFEAASHAVPGYRFELGAGARRASFSG